MPTGKEFLSFLPHNLLILFQSRVYTVSTIKMAKHKYVQLSTTLQIAIVDRI